MNPTLTSIRARRAEITKLRQALDLEDQELAVAERVVSRLEAHTAMQNENVDLSVPMVAHSSVSATAMLIPAPARQADFVIATLRASENVWFESSAALEREIAKTHGVIIKPTSLQPLLSNLKKRGAIVREGPRIALAQRAAGHADERDRPLLDADAT
jgi:hypothetical protein